MSINEKSYIRSGGQSRLMNRQEIRQAIVNSTPSRFEETQIYLKDANFSVWSKEFDFTEFIKRTRPSGFTSDGDLLEHLFSYKMVSRSNEKYFPTRLCVITCAKDFNKFIGFEKFGVRVLQYQSDNRLTAQKDITFNQGITLCLDEVVSVVADSLPKSEIIEQATRHNVSVLPNVVVRELVGNAIIHRDLTRNDSAITIEIFKDRVEITNPGPLLSNISIDRLIDHPSQSRNEVLADFMRKLNFSEERGSGIDKCIEATELLGLPPILFESNGSYFRARVFYSRNFVDMSKQERIEAVYQHTCLNYVFQKDTTNGTLRKRFQFSDKETTKIYRLLKEAQEQGRIKMKDPKAARKEVRYVPYWA